MASVKRQPPQEPKWAAVEEYPRATKGYPGTPLPEHDENGYPYADPDKASESGGASEWYDSRQEASNGKNGNKKLSDFAGKVVAGIGGAAGKLREIAPVDKAAPYDHRPIEDTQYTPGQNLDGLVETAIKNASVKKPAATDNGVMWSPEEQRARQLAAQMRAQQETQSNAAGPQPAPAASSGAWTVTTSGDKPVYQGPAVGHGMAASKPSGLSEAGNSVADMTTGSSLGGAAEGVRSYLDDDKTDVSQMPLREVLQKVALGSTAGKAAAGMTALFNKVTGSTSAHGVIDSKKKK